jgi:hypothetical protein
MKELHIYQSISKKNADNLFNADHRNAMIRLHGYTEAMKLTVGKLVGRANHLYFEATMEAIEKENEKRGLAF